MNTTAPTACAAWPRLAAQAGSAQPAFGAEGKAQAPGLALDFSRQRLDGTTLRLLAQLAAERGFQGWREAYFTGGKVNATEGRAAWHVALRAAEPPAEVAEAQARMKALHARVRNDFSRVVHLGTGGSDTGPRLLADAFGTGDVDVRYVANADPLELERALAGAVPARTLVVVVSKTFTTPETMGNAQASRAWGAKHFFAVTENAPAAQAFGAAEVLPVWDWVGGRFSVWSPVGFSALCAIGPEAFEAFLAGGRDLDAHFRQAPVAENVPALMALLGVWNTNFLGARAHAVVPYAHRLRLLPAYLQQLEMESNGKRVDREGRDVAHATCPVVFGMEGTNSQHAFHQLLHQGTEAVPVDIIDPGVTPVLSANARAQADALAQGTSDAALPPHQRLPGGRPCSLLAMEGLSPRALGRLIATYEHKVFTQGVLWNINSYDQWGVELGKALARRILDRP